MSLDSGELISRLRSLALRTGVFDTVEGHEPPSAPGKGIRGAIWVDDTYTIDSGLSVISAGVLLILRISKDLSQGTSEALDRVDPEITAAADAVLNEMARDFTLGGTIRCFDWRGQFQERVRAPSGYFEQDGHKYRSVSVYAPCLVNNVWTLGDGA
jgi:hypothetical protein